MSQKGVSGLNFNINDVIARINELSRKQKSLSLEAWEQAEQEAMRQVYLAFIRGQVKESLVQVRPEKI